GTAGENLHLPRRVIHERHLEAVAVAAHEDETLAVRERTGRYVVGAVERQSLDAAARKIDAIDLRRAAAVGREQQRAAVGREGGFGVDAVGREDAHGTSAVGVHHVDLRAAVARERDGETAPVRRPGGRAVAATEIGDRL